MNKDDQTDKEKHDQDGRLRRAKEIEYGSLLAVNLVVLPSLLSVSKTDIFINSALILQGFSIPMLAGAFVVKMYNKPYSDLFAAFAELAEVFTLVGVTLAIMNVYWFASAVFIITVAQLFNILDIPSDIKKYRQTHIPSFNILRRQKKTQSEEHTKSEA